MKTMTAIAVAALLLAGCAHRKDPRNEWVVLSEVIDPNDVVVACPDDGIHSIVKGRCVDTGHMAVPWEPCKISDGSHVRVNGVCVDVLGK